MVNDKQNIERGKRLQNLRKKVGLTRLAFAEQTGMSANTLKALELGDRELTQQKALLFSNLFSGLFSVSLGEDAHEASFEALYYGKTTPQSESTQETLNPDADNLRLQNDVNFFLSSPSHLILTIEDDLMSPFYNNGDIVAGKKTMKKSEFSRYQGHVCIIDPFKGKLMVRRIIKTDGHKVTCCLLNTSSSQAANIVEECEARSIAQTIWHWHLSQAIDR